MQGCNNYIYIYVCVCVCVCVRARARVRACVRLPASFWKATTSVHEWRRLHRMPCWWSLALKVNGFLKIGLSGGYARSQPKFGCSIDSLVLLTVTVKVCGSGGIAPLIFNLGTKWGLFARFTLWQLYPREKGPRYPLRRGLDGLQSRSDVRKKREMFCPCGEWNHYFWDVQHLS